MRILIVLALGFALDVRATERSIAGRVTDESGAPIPAASVVLLQADLAVVASMQSTEAGQFRFDSLGADTYSIQITKSAFSPARIPVRLKDVETAVEARLSVQPVASHITVTAETGRTDDVNQIAQRVNVIPRGEIEQRTSTVVADVFRDEVGVDVQRTVPGMGGVMVRGLLGKNVAVYRDGVRYTTSAQRGGVSTFFNLNEPTSLDTVEVLRGPNSAQYNSDSIGGTVHFLSRVPALGGASGWHGEFAPAYFSGSHSYGSNLLASYGGDNFGVLFNLAGRRTNTLRSGAGIDTHAAVTRFLGLPSTVSGDRLSDTAFTQYGGMFRGQFALNRRQMLVAHYERGQQDAGKRSDQLLGGDGNLIANLRNLMLDFGYLRYTHLEPRPFEQLSVTLSYNTQREERVNQGGNGNPLASIVHQYERIKVLGTNFHASKQISSHRVLIGGDAYRERAVAPAFTVNPANGSVTLSRPRIPDGARYLLYGLYLQDIWEPLRSGRLRVSGSVRFGGASYRSRASNSPLVNGNPLWPDDSATANNLSGRLGVVWRIQDGLLISSNYSRGFRAPSITDLSTTGIQGNGFYEASFSDLFDRGAEIGDRADDRAVSTGRPVERIRAETSDNYELGLRLVKSRLRAELTGFWVNLRDTIVSQTLILRPGALGLFLGNQPITQQLASGAVFVPAATAPVQIRGNLGEVDLYGFEHLFEVKMPSAFLFGENISWIYARDKRTGLAPDIEGGIPPLTANARLRWAPSGKSYWTEAYATLADRQDRLSSLALADRRSGASRSRANIANFFSNGARVRGFVANGILLPTGETLAAVQNRVLGAASSAPMFTAIPGYAVFGIRGGFQVSERSHLGFDLYNVADQIHRGVSWGVDGAGRALTLRYRMQF